MVFQKQNERFHLTTNHLLFLPLNKSKIRAKRVVHFFFPDLLGLEHLYQCVLLIGNKKNCVLN